MPEVAPDGDGIHQWLVGGALVEGPEGILLVQNRRRGGRIDWSPPGGVIDEGEELLDGLTREVREETGLEVTEWVGPIYEIDTFAPALGWRLRVETWVGTAFTGEILIDDPDGIVIDARFVPIDEHDALLRGAARWVEEPLREYLTHRWDGTRSFGYHVEGAQLTELVVTRL